MICTTSFYLLIYLVLHPRYKLSYFARAKWPQEWISDAEILVRKVWVEKYKEATPSTPVQPPRDSGTQPVSPLIVIQQLLPSRIDLLLAFLCSETLF